MKALRSSPFLPLALALQVVILLCWAVLAGALAALAGAEAALAGALAALTGADAAFSGALAALAGAEAAFSGALAAFLAGAEAALAGALAALTGVEAALAGAAVWACARPVRPIDREKAIALRDSSFFMRGSKIGETRIEFRLEFPSTTLQWVNRLTGGA